MVVGDRYIKRAMLNRQFAELNRAGANITAIREVEFLELYTPTREEALAMLRAGDAGLKRWQQLCQYPTELIALDLSKADLSLRDIYFGFAKLRGADLRRTDLSGASFRGTDLADADLRHVNLTSARFEAAKLSRARVEGANFEFATFWSTDFTPKQLAHGSRLGAATRRLE